MKWHVHAKKKIAPLVMETELQNKHQEKRKIKAIQSVNVLLSTSLSMIVCKVLLHQINIAVKS